MNASDRRRLVGVLSALAVAAALGACGSSEPSAPNMTSPPATDAGIDTSAPAPDAGDGGPTRAPFGLDARPSNTSCKAPARPPAPGAAVLQQVLQNINLVGPMIALARAPGDPTRWFAALQDGRIATFPTTNPAVLVTPTVVADVGALSGVAVDNMGEGGLLGLALHPKFADNGYLYVSWNPVGTNPSGMRSEIGRLTSHDNGATFTEYTTILGPFDQPETSHNGGDIHFGPDGLLYFGFGDGGGDGDPYGNGQTTTGFFSKILRIDVDHPAPGLMYGIPDGNPWKNGGGQPETFAYGFRNPYRFSIDEPTGDVWVGDVGQNLWEEVDIAKPGGNYGWSCREGAHSYNAAACPQGATFIDPLFEYDHTTGYDAIIGGVVYRGSAMPSLVGSYVFGDYASTVFTLTFDPTTGAPTSQVVPLPIAATPTYVDFVTDIDGEVLVLGYGGEFFKVVPAAAGPAPPPFPDRLSLTGCVNALDATKPAPGLVPYDVASPLWSDGAEKERYFAIPDAQTIAIDAQGDFVFPNGTVLMKTFSLGGQRIETRLFVRHDDGGWAGYDYAWNDAQTDALLLPTSQSKTIGSQTWRFPSRVECTECHTQAAGSSLGLELGQLNRDFVYAETNRVSNELATLDHIGLFSAPLAQPTSAIVAYPVPTEPGPLEPRARSYLHANCSQCHRPGGPGLGGLDLRYGTPLDMTGACGTTPQEGNLGVSGALDITPGSPSSSTLSLRPHAIGANRMPPIVSTVVDDEGVGVLDAWIKSLAVCPP